MLNKLHITNIALISECTISFDNGFNVLSGETGAGKSIIIDALNFLLGARGDKTLVKSGEDFAKVEGWFKLDSSLAYYDELFELLSLPKDDVLMLSRSFNLNGKSECKINGESYPLNILKKVGEYLVDVFGQNDHAFLLDTKKHVEFLDSTSKNINALKLKLKENILSLKNINIKISELGGDGAERERNIEILQYQINEIESANLSCDEEQKLNERKKILINAEKIINEVNEIENINNSANFSVNLKILSNLINNISKYYPEFDSLIERINDARYEIDDVLAEVSGKTGNIEYNENELNAIEERIDVINDLKRKYGKDIAAIKEYLINSKQKLDEMLNIGDVLANLNKDKNSVLKTIYENCVEITNERKIVSESLEKNIMAELKELGMKNATFEVGFLNEYSLDDIEKCVTSNGCDEIEFLFSANLGEPVKSLSKIISGGEMSRLMLAFKCVQNNNLQKTYVFDEIDTGIGGAVGSVVAKKLATISVNNQVLCVTHLAQIACFSDVSFKIQKYEQENKTYSKINPLSAEEKVLEITRMIGVGEVQDFAIMHAKELIKESEQIKKEIKTR